MNDEVTQLKIAELTADLTEIKNQLKTLPATISNSLNEIIELKMQVRINDLEKRFFKYIASLSFGWLSTAVGLIIKYILG